MADDYDDFTTDDTVDEEEPGFWAEMGRAAAVSGATVFGMFGAYALIAGGVYLWEKRAEKRATKAAAELKAAETTE